MSTATIIVLAYGPGQVTMDAVERAKRLAGPSTDVVVVAAVESARRFARRTRSARVSVTRGCGRAGLAEAIRDRPRGQLLLVVHDDVLVSQGTLSAMVAEHADSGAVVVPWNNDTHADTGIGSLPPVRHAAAAVTAAAAVAQRQQVRRVRPSCLVLEVGQLQRLLPMRLTVARTQLNPVGVNLVAAAGAVVAHDSTCVQQVVDPTDLGGGPLVTAAMIVRDEEEMLPDALASLHGFVDRIVVCDTGSVDDTIGVAAAAGAEVIEREWRDDFAWARNEVIEAALDSWYVLVIDADERLHVEDPAEVRRQLATDVHDSQGLTVTVRNLDGRGVAAITNQSVRLMCPGQGVRYFGAIHEIPAIDGQAVPAASLEGVYVDHLGYVAEVVQQKQKGRRKDEIARTTYQQERTAASALHLGRSLLLDGDAAQEAYTHLEEAVELGLRPVGLAHALSLLAVRDLAAGDVETARSRSREALELVPLEDEAGRVHAEACALLEDWDALRTTHEWRMSAVSQQPYTTSPTARTTELLHVAHARIAGEDPTGAAAAVRSLLSYEQELDARAWLEVVAMLAIHDAEAALQSLVTAATRDRTGGCVEAVARTYEPADAAAFVAAVLDAGAVSGRTVQVGMAVAVVAEREDLLVALAPLAHELTPDVVDALRSKAEVAGMSQAAAALGTRLAAAG